MGIYAVCEVKGVRQGIVLCDFWLASARQYCRQLPFSLFRISSPRANIVANRFITTPPLFVLSTVRRLMMAQTPHWFIFLFYFWQHFIRNFMRTQSGFHAHIFTVEPHYFLCSVQQLLIEIGVKYIPNRIELFSFWLSSSSFFDCIVVRELLTRQWTADKWFSVWIQGTSIDK